MIAQKENAPAGTGAGKDNVLSEATVPQIADSGNVVPLHYGASPEEWNQFDLVLGLTEDLLPVVSDPTATKAPESTMQGVGKTPSRFNRKGEMVGFAKWTSHTTTQDEIARWQKDSRLGICIQTRHVRAIDVDVGDFDEAFDIEEFVAEYLGIKLPCRRRKNSTKFLLAFRMDGEFTKRRFKTHTEGNFVEFLANGQQFIAIGQHTSGVRYEWDGGLPDSIPTLGVDEFEALWMVLAEKFGSEDSVTTRTGVKPSIARLADDIDDPMMDYLADHWEVFNVHSSGRVDIRCPFEAGHSTDSGPTSTSYYPAGVGGFKKGHFKCLHASCAHRTDQDFVDAVGYSAHGFEVIEVDTAAPPVLTDNTRQALASITRNTKGKSQASLSNLFAALSTPRASGWRIAFDRFTAQLKAARLPANEWETMTDNTLTRIRESLTQSIFAFEEIGKELAKDAINVVADDNAFDSAQDWINGLKWDGVKRIERFLPRYFGADDTEYTRAVSAYLWTALAGRVLVPGIKADMVPIAVGDQGLRKTSGVEAIAPLPGCFGKGDLAKKPEDLGRLLAGKLIVELGELAGLRKKAIEEVKQLISARSDEWIPKFKEAPYDQPRRCVFFGTSNAEKPLPHDPSGQRRWLPFEVKRQVDVDAITRDREQLWAEGADLFRRVGIQWFEAEKLAKPLLNDYVDEDAWTEIIKDFFATKEELEPKCWENGKIFTSADLLREAINLPAARTNQPEKNRMTNLVKRLSAELGIETKHTNSKRGFIRRE